MSQDVLDLARSGDEQAFRELVDPHRRELHVHCYRMLGSIADAEDIVQETLVAAWRGLGSFAGRSSLRTWLYRIATNRCLNALRDAGRRRPPEPSPPFDPPEPTRRADMTWLQPYPDVMLAELPDEMPGPEARYQTREAVELAFIAGLQRLPPRQIASIVLRDVLGYSLVEVAAMLETTPTAIKGTLQRARSRLEEHLQASPRASQAPQDSALAQRFADAFAAGDVDGIVALLTDDAWLTMPPAPHEYFGRGAIRAFFATFTEWRGHRHIRMLPTRAGGRPAFGCYIAESDEAPANPGGLLVVRTHGAAIGALSWFLDIDLAGDFALAQPTR